MKLARPIGFIRCKRCTERTVEVFISPNTIGAICTSCRSIVFNVRQLQRFINEISLSHHIYPMEPEDEDIVSTLN